MAKLVRVACPACGAGVELTSGQSTVTCAYCQAVSVVAHGTAPAPEGQRTIRLTPEQSGQLAGRIGLAIAGTVVGSFGLAIIAFVVAFGLLIALSTALALTLGSLR
jgi:LSD1 subclass zinc finger protein